MPTDAPPGEVVSRSHTIARGPLWVAPGIGSWRGVLVEVRGRHWSHLPSTGRSAPLQACCIGRRRQRAVMLRHCRWRMHVDGLPPHGRRALAPLRGDPSLAQGCGIGDPYPANRQPVGRPNGGWAVESRAQSAVPATSEATVQHTGITHRAHAPAPSDVIRAANRRSRTRARAEWNRMGRPMPGTTVVPRWRASTWGANLYGAAQSTRLAHRRRRLRRRTGRPRCRRGCPTHRASGG